MDAIGMDASALMDASAPMDIEIGRSVLTSGEREKREASKDQRDALERTAAGCDALTRSALRSPRMAKPPSKRWSRRDDAKRREPKRDEPKKPPSRFAPSAFLTGSPESVQRLCEDLAAQAAARFADLTGTSWSAVGRALAEQLRASGHDLSSFDESESHQEWQATWHHPRGTFSLFLSFRAPASVEVTWRTDEGAFTAKA